MKNKEQPGELQNDNPEDTLETLKKIAEVHAERAAELMRCKVTITYHQNITRKQLAEAYGVWYTEKRAEGSNEPNKLLEAQYMLRTLNEQFKAECDESERFFLDLLTKPEDE